MRSSTPTSLRIASLIVGAVLLLAGVTKTLAPQAFLESLSGYGLPQPLGVGVALVLPAIEILLGVMLLALWARSLGGVLESWQRSVLAGIGFGVLVCTGILLVLAPDYGTSVRPPAPRAPGRFSSRYDPNVVAWPVSKGRLPGLPLQPGLSHLSQGSANARAVRR